MTDLEREERFIAAVVKDDTGDRWRESRDISPEAFSDRVCRDTWYRISRAASFEEAFQSSLRFLAHETTGIEYRADRFALLCGWLMRDGPNVLPEVVKLQTSSQFPAPMKWNEFEAAPPPEPEVLVEGVLNRARTMLLCGPSKARKTFTFLYLLLCVAYGRPFLGFPVRKGRALYVNLELAPFELYRRLRRIASAMGIEPGPDVLVWNLRGKSIDAATIAREIRQKCQGMALVIIDPWYRINARSGAEENSNDQQADLLMQLEAAAHDAGAALAIGHHFAKGDASAKNFIDRASGAGVFARLPDVFLSMTEHKEADAMIIDLALREFPPVEQFVVRCEHPLWVRDEALNPADLKKAGRTNEHPASELLALLKDGMSNAEWRAASGWGDGTYRRRRDELMKKRQVQQLSGCFYHASPQSPESPKSIVAA